MFFTLSKGVSPEKKKEKKKEKKEKQTIFLIEVSTIPPQVV